ncbi:hypothetical protein JHK87_040006 [Glycine soja]|nr:hypothetical protein JHK87_040006 [Glycine soja]
MIGSSSTSPRFCTSGPKLSSSPSLAKSIMSASTSMIWFCSSTFDPTSGSSCAHIRTPQLSPMSSLLPLPLMATCPLSHHFSVQPFRFLILTRSFTTHNFKIPKTLTLINHLRSILLKSIPTIKKIVNSNQSAPYDTTSHALCRNLASEMLHPSRVSLEFGLNALYDSVNGGGDVWINENCFRIVRQLREGGFT